jgi:hypothetical protein
VCGLAIDQMESMYSVGSLHLIRTAKLGEGNVMVAGDATDSKSATIDCHNPRDDVILEDGRTGGLRGRRRR